MADISPDDLKNKVFSLFAEEDLSNITKKQARAMLEKQFGMAKGSFRPRKQEINQYLSELVQSREEEEEPEPEPETARPKKRQRVTKKTDSKEKAEKSFLTITKSGNDAPKKLKEAQAGLMTAQEFLDCGEEIKLDLFGNKLIGRPRVFSSGNMGWYLGGKIEIPINGKTVWCQAGINVTIPGSNTWEKEDE
mmetsp:Transcript_13/g.33  ORF Transcript_13/g.33 Transcript_13/m.33 type:complete len:192 (-) Transcript_13:290-865(-)|eukprot:CAMPEP_0114524228 /NCGR_PEP_ID=MMETSP0109-20121206/21733_1 /TAXON_ID=29199 /ORGANISM="Chlorarachnion reptans, Strain CCCM449" /LENGTH=191 /DNA_ID=CAMNT_0001705637 /DNA_START=199 /DNA_END=774 /DNA_ORIENTATION=+